MKEILAEVNKRLEKSRVILAKSENTSLKLALRIRLMKEALKN